MVKKINKSFEVLNIISSIIMVIFLLIVLYFSVSYWTENFDPSIPIKANMFYVGILIAIVTTIAQWIEGKINTIILSFNLIKRRYSNGKIRKGSRRRNR